MTATILLKVQTADRFGAVLQCSDESCRLKTLKEYCDEGWEISALCTEGAAGALVVLRRDRPPS